MASPNIAVKPAQPANPATNHPAGHSTGPRTAEGKARSAQNARKHGFSAVTLQVLPSEQAEFDIYQNELLDQIKPAAGLQADLFRQLVHAGWSLVRLERYEFEILEQGNPFNSADSQIKLDRLERYRASHRRAYVRILNEIRKLQTDALLWSTTHADVQDMRKRDFPIANPAASRLNPRIAKLSDECNFLENLRSSNLRPQRFAAHLDKTNSPAAPIQEMEAAAGD